MYDTLAMSMKIAGRPQKDIERVLLSRIDFTTTDIPGLLYSAAFLARLEAPGQALRMYRQAATLAPEDRSTDERLRSDCLGLLRHPGKCLD
jgi:hypothetical protein